MYKKRMVASGVAMAVAALPVLAEESPFGEFEVSGEIKNESAVFTRDGSVVGDFGTSTANGSGATGNYTGVTTASIPTHDRKDVMKSESSVRLFINGPVGDNSELHAELRPVRDSEAVESHKGHESYTQQDFLRELYIDTTSGEDDEISLRIGKQQVVWGTADGMKLLDIINPTDYREMAQNTMDESRIPVWMINAETDLEDGANLQVVISQPKENLFAGLNRGIDTSVRSNNQFLDDTTLNNGTDTGHPFMMKGPDSITGVHNGFLNITPDMGSVATRFGMAFTPTSVTGSGVDYNGALATIGNLSAGSMQGFTVDGFEAMTMEAMNGALANASQGQCTATFDSGQTTGTVSDLNCIPAGFAGAISNTWNGLVGQMGSAGNVQGYLGLANANMDELTGEHMLALGFQPLYNTNLADIGVVTTAPDTVNDAAFDYMGSTTFRTFDSFVNASSQYVFNMPGDSDLDAAFRVKHSLDNGLNYSLNYSYNYDKNPIINLSWRGDTGQELTSYDVVCPASACGAETVTVGLYDSAVATANGATPEADGFYSAANGAYGGAAGKFATLRFEQAVKRAHNIGSAFDYSLDTEALGPVVLRGEFLYQNDVYQPVMNLDRLSVGDLVGALQMEKGDRFKYVLGADITVLTNMMVSAQIIEDRNLDHVESGNRYTTDYATMHLSNGFNKATENKNFYSLFFSKPFGAEQQHRWNNIFMYEENGGRWNRFDVEYSFNDELIGLLEYDKYWGNTNTQFGQLKNSSNATLGLKYIF